MLSKFSHLSNLRVNYELGKKTWFGSGGNCLFFYEANSFKNLITILRIYKRFMPVLILGCGSNILIRDGGFKGLVIKLGKNFKEIKFDQSNCILSLGSAVKDIEISKFCLQNNISGFEFLSGIPGTIGGNLKMNAGCFGAQISDNLIDCNILNKNYKIEKLTKKELNFSYRKSSFSNDQIIINARFKTFHSDKKLIKKRLEEISRKRKKSQPVSSRTGGSTFTNPPHHSAWKLIDSIDFRGKRHGGASVSELHSNFLINDDSATSLDIEILGEEIKYKVWKKFKINLDWELLRIGEFKKI